MYSYPTTYHRARTLSQARGLYSELDQPSYLAGGHTLLPAMKNRLSAPSDLIDLRGIDELRGIALDGDRLVIGAATCHADVAASATVAQAIPALARLAGSIGDVQVRNMGTIGGSVANNDPAADYPSAVLSLDAAIVTDRRELAAEEFFDGLYATVLEPGEIVLRFVFPLPKSAGYAKMRNPASRYALCASFVTCATDGSVRVAITGAGSGGVFRWTEAEAALGATFTPEAVAGLEPDASDMLGDMHGSAEYRASLVRVMTMRAVASQGGAAID
jgi:aerobic carbon-monoxide dehydrogenase medium subunit